MIIEGLSQEARRPPPGAYPELLELAGAAFDEMAQGVEVCVKRVFARSRWIVWDNGERALGCDGQPEVVGVIGCTATMNSVGMPSMRGPACGTSRSRSEHEAYRAPHAAHGEMDVGGQAAPRAPYGLISSPPFAPLECW